eukprot:6776117-Ditylum_brightwellii.AAC.1
MIQSNDFWIQPNVPGQDVTGCDRKGRDGTDVIYPYVKSVQRRKKILLGFTSSTRVESSNWDSIHQ